MINQNILAIGSMVFASATGAAAQAIDERAMNLVIEVQGLSAYEGPEKRDHLVEAAYLARRVVEDTPESPAAALLRGSGIEVFGSEPIRYEALQDMMIDACIDTPNALCLVDMAYVVGTQAMSFVASTPEMRFSLKRISSQGLPFCSV